MSDMAVSQRGVASGVERGRVRCGATADAGGRVLLNEAVEDGERKQRAPASEQRR
jgi:hypothetical protein